MFVLKYQYQAVSVAMLLFLWEKDGKCTDTDKFNNVKGDNVTFFIMYNNEVYGDYELSGVTVETGTTASVSIYIS